MNYRKTLEKNAYFSTHPDYVLDNLTGVLSRDSLNAYIQDLISDKKPFSLCIFDIDNFKTINDTYGHLTGDEILIALTDFISSLLNEKAIIGRFGGDEFMIVFEDLQEYNDIWQSCFDLHHALRKNTLFEICGVDITITMGIARFPLNATTHEELFNLADKALYRGKMKGRNCYIIYLPEKHANLVLEEKKEVKISNIYMISQCLSILRRKKDYKTRLRVLFSFIKNQFNLDHICFQDLTKIVVEVTDDNAKYKEFRYFDHNSLKEEFNTMGYFTLNRSGNVLHCTPEVLEEADNQKIRGMLAVLVKEGDQDIGIIRAEMAQGDRIWQNTEITTLVTIAALMAKDIFYQNIEF